ncbi:hypothetical protein DAI22_11g206600 [Oryza sativa Japonica Group]|nr:hypothetical protein DAI22_11g206600 [Oryza sativa Japonica Group]
MCEERDIILREDGVSSFAILSAQRRYMRTALATAKTLYRDKNKLGYTLMSH